MFGENESIKLTAIEAKDLVAPTENNLEGDPCRRN